MILCQLMAFLITGLIAVVGEIPLGGMSYAMAQCEERGDNINDCLYEYPLANDDKAILYRIVEAEVTGTGDEKYFDAKCNVASCVIARIEQGWGESVSEVVFAKGQFSPVSDGRYYTVTITEQTREAVDYVLMYGKTHSCTYFCTRTCKSRISGYHSTLHYVFGDVEHDYFEGVKYEKRISHCKDNLWSDSVLYGNGRSNHDDGRSAKPDTADQVTCHRVSPFYFGCIA